jgi:dipeptidyl aminopeptidase/acylaminoacyl peptidase
MFGTLPRISSRPWLRHLPGLGLLCLFLGGVGGFAADPAKRPLTHADYDGWRSISNQTLSNDGRYLAYFVMPQEGDGEMIVRHLVNGTEKKHPRGGKGGAADPGAGPGSEAAAPVARGGRPYFTADGRFLVFNSSPTKGEIAAAKAAKRKADEMPQAGMAVMDLSTGQVTTTERVRSFQVPEDGSSWIAYSKEPKPDPAAEGARAGAARGQAAAPGGAQAKGQGQGKRGGGRGGAPGAPQNNQPRPQVGSDLVLRNLADGRERVLPDVNDFNFTKDGKLLVFSTVSKSDDANGVFVLAPESTAPPLVLLRGKGKYSKMTWDEKQTQFAFMSDRDTARAKQPTWKIYYWTRKTPEEIARLGRLQVGMVSFPGIGGAFGMLLPLLQSTPVGQAAELVGAELPNCRPGLLLAERGPLTFSQDGARIFFGLAKPTPPAPERPARPAAEENPAPAPPAEERVSLDLWHWKDDYIQPMQKLRAGQEKNRTTRAVVHLREHKLVQLADEAVPEVNAVGDGAWALGVDDRPYRILVGQDTNYVDYYLVNTWDGTRKPLLKKHQGGILFSPSAKNAIFFDGANWNGINLVDGRAVNLTRNLGVAFYNEDTDTPSQPPAYGASYWSSDEKQVILADRYDLWLVAVDGSGASNLTGGAGRKLKTQFRIVRLDPNEKTLDVKKPILVRAEEEATRSTGFFRAHADGRAPEKLVFGACDYTAPVKAKNADTWLLSSMTFHDYPDLLVTNSDFKEVKKVTDVGAQRNNFVWGKAEMIHYKNADGVLLSGTLIKPEDFDPKKKYPMMVYIYERLSQNLHHFVAPGPGTSINASYYASNGYLVLEPDIVYTIGYPGQSALKCVLPAIQAVVDQGIVDEKAIGIQGHSWGGYQIAYMITQTNRFRAVEAGAPVANMTSAYSGIRWGTGTPRQFQYEHTQSRIGGNLWQYPMRFIENSPVFMADRVQTPLMILHNDQDDAVPWYQGIEYYLALRRLDKEVYLFNYNGELHGLRRRVNQKDYTVRMQQFFDHYLKGAARPDWMDKGEPFIEKAPVR